MSVIYLCMLNYLEMFSFDSNSQKTTFYLKRRKYQTGSHLLKSNTPIHGGGGGEVDLDARILTCVLFIYNCAWRVHDVSLYLQNCVHIKRWNENNHVGLEALNWYVSVHS